METEREGNSVSRVTGQCPPSVAIAVSIAQRGKWNYSYLVREVLGEGLGKEAREEVSGLRSHCSSWSISSSSVRPPAGGDTEVQSGIRWGRGSQVKSKWTWERKKNAEIDGLGSGYERKGEKQ